MGGPATLLGRLGKPRGVDAGVGNRKKQIRTVTGPLHSPGPGGGALSWNISHHHKEHGSAQRSVDFQPNLAFRCPKHAPCLSLLASNSRLPSLPFNSSRNSRSDFSNLKPRRYWMTSASPQQSVKPP